MHPTRTTLENRQGPHRCNVCSLKRAFVATRSVWRVRGRALSISKPAESQAKSHSSGVPLSRSAVSGSPHSAAGALSGEAPPSGAREGLVFFGGREWSIMVLLFTRTRGLPAESAITLYTGNPYGVLLYIYIYIYIYTYLQTYIHTT